MRGETMWLAPEKNGEKDLQLSFSEFKPIDRAWGLREITFGDETWNCILLEQFSIHTTVVNNIHRWQICNTSIALKESTTTIGAKLGHNWIVEA